MLRAAAYIRVSTEEQSEFSPDAQLYAIRQYAEKNGMMLEEDSIFRDEGFSGRIAEKRPAFMRMISRAKAKPKPFDVILVHKFDRFARSREDSIVYKSMLRKDCKIKVISISEQLEDDKFSVILESMLEAMAEYYSLNLGDEVKKGMTEKARRGELQTPAPFGYRMTEGRLEIKEDEAETVRDIFRKYSDENMNSRNIAKYVNSLGCLSKMGNPFDKRLIEYIIYNPVYIGKMRWTPTCSAACKHDFDNPDTLIIDGKHESIVDPDLWERANRKIRERAKTRPRYQHDGTVTTHWLKGMLRCSHCGGTLAYGKAYPPRQSAYRCNRYLMGGCTEAQRITVAAAEAAVLETLLEDSGRFPQTEYHKTSVSPETSENLTANYKKLLEKNSAKLNKAKELVLCGADSNEEYIKNKTELLFERERIEKALEEIRKQDEQNGLKNFENPAHAGKIKSIYDILISPAATLTEKNQALREIVRKIVYDKKAGTMAVYYYCIL